MDLTALKKIETARQYEAVRSRLDELIREATEKGLLEPEADNKYTREIGRLSYLGAIYENEYIAFRHLTVRKKSPLIQSIEAEMYNRSIRRYCSLNFLPGG